MAHWFHRNPIKATAIPKFNESNAASTPESRRICSLAEDARKQLLVFLTDCRHSDENADKTVNTYFSLLHGFVTSCTSKEQGLSKLRTLTTFKWTMSLLGTSKVFERTDFVFELLNMLVNVALWYSKHAACVAGANATPTMEEAKKVHTCLRTAAGIFHHVKNFLPNLESNLDADKGTDMDAQVLSAYMYQCQAEAQEITIARAIEMKHSPSIVSALAYETAKLYENAELDLRPLEATVAGKWQAYCSLKHQFYLAYAHTYYAEVLLEKEKAGSALRGLQEAAKCYDKAKELAKTYASAKGEIVSKVAPEKHLFFRKLESQIKLTVSRVSRENDLLHHQKVDFDPPQLELKATYGLVAAGEWEMPPPHELWSENNYDSFDHSKGATSVQLEKESAKGGSTGEKLKKPEEVPVPGGEADAKNESGCTIS